MGGANVKLYAVWKLKTYTITYDGGSSTGGSAPAAGSKTHGVTYTVSESFPLTKEDYIQIGWTTTAERTDATGIVTTLTDNQATTLYPVWRKNTYTISVTAPTFTAVNYGYTQPDV